METAEIMRILNSSQPYYHEMEQTYQQVVAIDEEKAKCKKGLSGRQIAIGVVLMLFLYFIPGIIYFCIKIPQAKKQYQEKIDALDTQKQTLLGKAEIIIQNLLKTGIDDIFPSNIWTNPNDMQYIYSYFTSGRADTVKESLNLLAEDKHRTKMESMQAEMLHLQHQTNQQLFWGNMINAATALEVNQIKNRL